MGSKDVVREVQRCEDSGDVRDGIVLLTLSRHRDDVDVQAECLRVLANMCSGNDENRRVAGRRGAIQAVVDARRATEETRTSRRKGMAISWLRGCGGFEERTKAQGEGEGSCSAKINKQGKHSTYNYRTVHARLSFKQEL